ncbi:MAG TPA: cupredoxin family copper-binding protein [Actinomycetes bacterium]
MRSAPVRLEGLPVRRGLTVLVLLVSGALIAAGCGGGSNDSGGGGSASPATTAVPSPTTAAPDDNGGGAADAAQAKIENFAFAPKRITAKIGETVSWKNDDGATHTVTADDGSFDSGSLASDKTFSQTFDEAGTFKYHCAIHSSMIATVVVS